MDEWTKGIAKAAEAEDRELSELARLDCEVGGGWGGLRAAFCTWRALVYRSVSVVCDPGVACERDLATEIELCDQFKMTGSVTRWEGDNP